MINKTFGTLWIVKASYKHTVSQFQTLRWLYPQKRKPCRFSLGLRNEDTQPFLQSFRVSGRKLLGGLDRQRLLNHRQLPTEWRRADPSSTPVPPLTVQRRSPYEHHIRKGQAKVRMTCQQRIANDRQGLACGSGEGRLVRRKNNDRSTFLPWLGFLVCSTLNVMQAFDAIPENIRTLALSAGNRGTLLLPGLPIRRRSALEDRSQAFQNPECSFLEGVISAALQGTQEPHPLVGLLGEQLYSIVGPNYPTADWDALYAFLKSGRRKSMSRMLRFDFEEIESALQAAQRHSVGTSETTREQLWARLQALRMEDLYHQLQRHSTSHPTRFFGGMPCWQQEPSAIIEHNIIDYVARVLIPDSRGAVQAGPFRELQRLLASADTPEGLQAYGRLIAQCYACAKTKNLGNPETRNALETLFHPFRRLQWKEMNPILHSDCEQVLQALVEPTDDNTLQALSLGTLNPYLALILDPRPLPEPTRQRLWDALSNFLRLDSDNKTHSSPENRNRIRVWASRFDAIETWLKEAEYHAWGSREMRKRLRAHLHVLHMQGVYHQLQCWTMQACMLRLEGEYCQLPDRIMQGSMPALCHDSIQTGPQIGFEKAFATYIACILVPDGRSFSKRDPFNGLQQLLDETRNPEKANGYYEWMTQCYEHAKANNLGNAETRSALEGILNESRLARLQNIAVNLKSHANWDRAVASIAEMNSDWDWIVSSSAQKDCDSKRLKAFCRKWNTIANNPKDFSECIDTCVALALDPRQINLPDPEMALKVMSHFLSGLLRPHAILQASYRDEKERVNDWAYRLDAIQRRANKTEQYGLGVAKTRKQLRRHLLALRLEGLYHQLHDPCMRQAVLETFSSLWSDKKWEPAGLEERLGSYLALELDPNSKEDHPRNLGDSWFILQNHFNGNADLLSTQVALEAVDYSLHYARLNGLGNRKTRERLTQTLSHFRTEQLWRFYPALQADRDDALHLIQHLRCEGPALNQLHLDIALALDPQEKNLVHRAAALKRITAFLCSEEEGWAFHFDAVKTYLKMAQANGLGTQSTQQLLRARWDHAFRKVMPEQCMEKMYHGLCSGSIHLGDSESDHSIGAHIALALLDPLAYPEHNQGRGVKAVETFFQCDSRDTAAQRLRCQIVDRCLRLAEAKKMGTETTRAILARLLNDALSKTPHTAFEQMRAAYREITRNWTHAFYSFVCDPDEKFPLFGEVQCPTPETIGAHLALALDSRRDPYPGYREGLWAVGRYLQAADKDESVRQKRCAEVRQCLRYAQQNGYGTFASRQALWHCLQQTDCATL